MICRLRNPNTQCPGLKRLSMLLASSGCTAPVYNMASKQLGLFGWTAAVALLTKEVVKCRSDVLVSRNNPPLGYMLNAGQDNLVFKQFRGPGSEKFGQGDNLSNFVNTQTNIHNFIKINTDDEFAVTVIPIPPINPGQPNKLRILETLENGFLIDQKYSQLVDKTYLNQSLFAKCQIGESTKGPSSSFLNYVEQQLDGIKVEGESFRTGDTEYILHYLTATASHYDKCKNIGATLPVFHYQMHLLRCCWMDPIALLLIIFQLMLVNGNTQRTKFKPVFDALFRTVRKRVESEIRVRQGLSTTTGDTSADSSTTADPTPPLTAKVYNKELSDFAALKSNVTADFSTDESVIRDEEIEDVDFDDSVDDGFVLVMDGEMMEDFLYYVIMYCLLGLRGNGDSCTAALIKPSRMLSAFQQMGSAWRDCSNSLQTFRQSMHARGGLLGEIYLDVFDNMIVKHCFAPWEQFYLYGDLKPVLTILPDAILLFAGQNHPKLFRAFSGILNLLVYWMTMRPDIFKVFLENGYSFNDIFLEFVNSLISNRKPAHGGYDFGAMQEQSLLATVVHNLRQLLRGPEYERILAKRAEVVLANGVIRGRGEARLLHGSKPYEAQQMEAKKVSGFAL